VTAKHAVVRERASVDLGRGAVEALVASRERTGRLSQYVD